MRKISRWCFVSALVASAAGAEPGTWTRIGPEGGKFSAVAIDPDEPDRMHAISNHQLYGRTAPGQPWRPLEPALYSDAIGVYAAGRMYVGGSGGLYRSRDRGEHFERLPVPGTYVSVVAADRNDPEVVYIVVYGAVQGAGGLYRSSDGGATWSSLGSGLPDSERTFALVVDPDDGDTVYAAVHDRGLFVSRDGAATWSGLNAELPCPAAGGSNIGCIVSFAIVPGAAPALLVGARRGGLLRSTDGGATWQNAEGEIATQIVTALGVAGDAGTVYAGVASDDGFGSDGGTRFRVLQSSDGGSNWRAVSAETLPAAVAALTVPSDGGSIVFAATGDATRVGLGFDEGAGLYRSSDGAASWQLDENGLTGTCPGEIAAVPTVMTTLYAEARYDPERVYARRDAGSWDGAGLQSSFIAGLDVDPNDPLRVYAIAGDGVLSASSDGGISWRRIEPNGAPFFQAFDLAVDGRDARTLYVAARPNTGADGSARIYLSRDGGVSWRDTLTLSNVELTAKVVVEPGSNSVYALSDTALFRSRDAGESWDQLVQTSESVETLWNLTVAPTTPPTLLRESTSGLRISADDGGNWSEPRFSGVGGMVAIAAVAVDPSHALTLYALVDDYHGRSTLHRSDDGGGMWRAVADAPPSLFTTALAVDPHDRGTIYAATCGTGVQMLTQSSTAGGSDNFDGCAVAVPERPIGWRLGAHVMALVVLLAARCAGRRVRVMGRHTRRSNR